MQFPDISLQGQALAKYCVKAICPQYALERRIEDFIMGFT